MTREEAKRKIFEYVEIYYNTRKAHSTSGCLSPFEYEKQEFSLNNWSAKEEKVKFYQ